MPTDANLGYRPELDGLRGIAILLVLVTHVFHVVHGQVGVDVFFVLSGFLITTILLEERDATGRISLKHFYLRRFRRLGPPLLAMLAVYAVVIHLVQPELRGLRTSSLFYALSYSMDWATAFSLPTAHELSHIWSLSVEEKFYALWPLAVVFLAHRRLWKVALGVIVGVVFLRLALVDEGWNRIYMAAETRFDQLLIGCLLGIGWNKGWIPKTPTRYGRWAGYLGAVGLIELVAIQPALRLAPESYAVSFVLVGVSVAALMYGVLTGSSVGLYRVLSSKALVALGLVSYSLYLWHVLVIDAVEGISFTGHPRWVLATALSLVMATLSFISIERPLHARRLRSPRPSPHRGYSAVPVPDSAQVAS